MNDGGITPLILNLRTARRFIFSLTPQLLYSWVKRCLYSLNGRLCGTHSRSGRFGGVNFFSLQRIVSRFLDRRFRSLVTMTSELSTLFIFCACEMWGEASVQMSVTVCWDALICDLVERRLPYGTPSFLHLERKENPPRESWWCCGLKVAVASGRPVSETQRHQTALLTASPRVTAMLHKVNGFCLTVWHRTGKELFLLPASTLIRSWMQIY